MKLRSFGLKAGIIVALCAFAHSAIAQNTVTVDYGATTVKLASGFLSGLQGLNVTIGVVAPTRLTNGDTVQFPIVGGAVDLDTAWGNIFHTGGITLTAAGIQTRLQSFIIDTTMSPPAITGLVVVKNKLVGRLPLFDLTSASGLTVPVQPQNGNYLDLGGVTLKLDSKAAAALSSVYGIPNLSGIVVGTATVQAVVSR